MLMRVILSLSLLSTVPVYGQSGLPPCDANAVVASWTACFGGFIPAVGHSYIGEFKGGKPHGQGTFTFADKTKYEGEFREGKRHGHGSYTFTNGDRYVGEWRDNERTGQGTITWANGLKYVGEFFNGRRHGHGTIFFADGVTSSEGLWQDNSLVSVTSLDHSQQAASLANKPEAVSPTKLELASRKCRDLGLKSKTEKFGECVLRLSK